MKIKTLTSVTGVLLLLCLICTVPLRAGFVSNPSFEDSYNPTFPHYGANAGWAGGGGSNNSSGPFHNGGTPIPDRFQAAFVQGSGSLSQPIFGLTPGQTYWIQFYYDARACCGGAIDLMTKWDGATLDTVTGVTPSTGGTGYKFRNVAFTPTSSSGSLTFATLAAGDATVLLDGVSITCRDAGQVVVMNPGFEASATPPAPGLVSAVAGWTSTVPMGVNNASGPYADNGSIPEQDHVGVLQGVVMISQTIKGLVPGETYAVDFRYNARSGNTPQLDVSVDGGSIFNASVAPVGTSAAYRSGSANFTAAGASALLSFAQTAAGDNAVLLDDIRVAGVVVEPIPNLRVSPAALEIAPGLQDAVSFTVSERRLQSGDCTVIVRTANPAVANFVGADGNGEISLTFPQGGSETTLMAQVEGVARGGTSVVIVDNGGHDGVDGTVQVNVVTSLVRNPSFDALPPNPGVGYGSILAWLNAPPSSGINNGFMPFLDNGAVPDRDNVAFLQGGPQALAQQIIHLVPGQQYAIQAFYNARGCCGGSIDMTVRFAGVDLATVLQVQPVGAGQPFHFINVPFLAGADSGLLEFVTASFGDASLLLDAICIVPQTAAEVVIRNPSFEASGLLAYPGYMGGLAGWTTTGGHGVNVDGMGPFSDNGTAGAQDRVAFLQQFASLSQVIEGLTPGAPYTLSYLVNARSGDSFGPAPYRVLIDGSPVVEEAQDAVGPGNPYNLKSSVFTPAGATALLMFECTETVADQTLLLDDIHIFAGTGSVALFIAPLGSDAVDVTWPTSAPASLVLKFSTTMGAGSWSLLDSPPYVDGGMNHVLDVVDGPRKFYRLEQP